MAVDETGVVAVAHYRRVTFTDPTGAGLDIVVDAGQCCLSRVAIALLAVGADGSSYPTQTDRRMVRVRLTLPEWRRMLVPSAAARRNRFVVALC